MPDKIFIVENEGSESRDEMSELFAGYTYGEMERFAKCYATEIIEYVPAGWTAALEADKARLEKKLKVEELDMTQVLEERDNAVEWADKLSIAIAQHLNVEIGEHTTRIGFIGGVLINNPWENALAALSAVKD